MSQKRIDDLRNLITSNENSCFSTSESQRLRYPLPQDYLFLVNQRSKVRYKTCYPTVTKLSTTTSEYIWIIPLFTDEVDYTNFNIKTTTPNTTIFSVVSQFGNYLVGMEQFLADLLVDEVSISNSNYEVYYEVYKTVYQKNALIIKWLGASAPISDDNLIAYRAESQSYEANPVSFTTLSIAGSTSRYVLNRYGQQDDVFSMMKDPFSRTHPEEPLTVINSNFIDVFTDTTFTIESILLYYIRKPFNVSLSLQQNIELPEHTHQEIVDIAVGLMIETLESKRINTQLPLTTTQE